MKPSSHYLDAVSYTHLDVYKRQSLHFVDSTALIFCGDSSVIKSGTGAEWNFDKFPCHTQAVERCVKVVTEASQKNVAKSRDGFIRTMVLSRSIMPRFLHKSEFKIASTKKNE